MKHPRYNRPLLDHVQEIVNDIIKTSDQIRGTESGGIEPANHIISVKKRIKYAPSDEIECVDVRILYQYPKSCGLSDRVYHPVQDIQKMHWQFDANGIFMGDIVEPLLDYMVTSTIDGDTRYTGVQSYPFLFIWSRNEIDQFFERHPEQAPANWEQICNSVPKTLPEYKPKQASSNQDNPFAILAAECKENIPFK